MQFNDLGKQWKTIREVVLEKIDKVGQEGSYINGKSVSEFEQQFAEYFDSKYAIGVSNGTDGLKLALQTYDLGSGDLVIMPANTFIADYLAVKNLPSDKPKIALVDQNEYFTIDVDSLESFLEKWRPLYGKVVVIPVHLYGQSCDMDKILELSKKYNFSILEDCSQSHETRYKGNHLGSYGDMAVYSLYPGKNLGAAGDAGIITTNSEELNVRLRSLRNYGSKVKYYYDELGNNHRLDSMQAIVLSEKLKHLNSWTITKNKIVTRFLNEMSNSKVTLPKLYQDCTTHSYHIFCVMVDDRQSFEKHMASNGITTIIHYPIPIHKTSIFDSSMDIVYSSKITDEWADKIVSLPIHPFLTTDEIDLIINSVNSF
jgi:dTDP-4-amino-4,6-dideoxygalactose transaminase